MVEVGWGGHGACYWARRALSQEVLVDGEDGFVVSEEAGRVLGLDLGWQVDVAVNGLEGGANAGSASEHV